MNKAKIIFTALIALAAVGGAFALKASRFTGLFAVRTTIGTLTFTTTQGGKIYVCSGIVFCTTAQNATREPPGAPTFTPTTVVPGTITCTASDGSTTTILLPYKNCGQSVNIFLTEQF